MKKPDHCRPRPLGARVLPLLGAALIAAFSWYGDASADPGPLSASDVRIYREAFAKQRQGQLWIALRQARKATDPLPGKVLHWYYLYNTGSGASFAEIAEFLEANPDWPFSDRLRLHAEKVMPAELPDTDVVAYFDRYAPMTISGHERCAGALERSGASGAANTQLRQAWIESDFLGRGGRLEETRFHKRYVAALREEDHFARVERLLWRNRVGAARRMLPLLGNDHRALAEAWIRLLRRSRDESDARRILAGVPEALRRHPGLRYALLRLYNRWHRNDLARHLLHSAPTELGEPAKWWVERNIQVRRAMDAGDHHEAYELVRNHGLTSGGDFAEAAFLSGWIALRFLEQPAAALRHFENMYGGVTLPVNLARAAYWAGRAADALGRPEKAREWYRLAGKHPSSYYGQLGAARLGADFEPELPGPIEAAEQIDFKNQELVRVALMMEQLGQRNLEGVFLRQLFQTAKSPGERALVSAMVIEGGSPVIAVATAIRAQQNGHPLLIAGYPLVEVPAGDKARRHAPEDALVLAVIRQESQFRLRATSGTGARGLMQLMPQTAQQMAQKLRIRYVHGMLTRDPSYNMKLGRAYLGELLARYRGHYVLALAAYNAGPYRVQTWLAENGDPRKSAEAAVDWIEQIPYPETRNYVQRVLENLQIYRWRLGVGDLVPAKAEHLFGPVPATPAVVANGAAGPEGTPRPGTDDPTRSDATTEITAAAPVGASLTPFIPTCVAAPTGTVGVTC